MHWKTVHRTLSLERPLVMGILNVTPDSFSDGGVFAAVDDALRHTEQMIADGADIIDIGGESTRPGSVKIDAEEELRRSLPVVSEIAKRFDIPISIDTTKSEVAKALIDNGAEIINDISGLRWDARLAEVAAGSGAGLILMHSLGTFETLHSQPPVDDILSEVTTDFERSIALAASHGIANEQIVLDIGIGFGKTPEQNLELIAKLDRIVLRFKAYPILVGASRKSFLGKILGGIGPDARLSGSLAAAAIAGWNGASVIRVHDVKETVESLKVVSELKRRTAIPII